MSVILMHKWDEHVGMRRGMQGHDGKG